MLGLVGKQKELLHCTTTVRHGKNVFQINLQPWDIVIDVPKSAKFPDGKKIIPAASQEDFQRLLELVPERKAYIQELTPQQESEALASLAAGCQWYKDKNIKSQEAKTDVPKTESKPLFTNSKS